jgi:hypothetical protein
VISGNYGLKRLSTFSITTSHGNILINLILGRSNQGIKWKNYGNLDEVLLCEDIGGFLGMFLYNTIKDIKENCDIMSNDEK